jgi:multidrug efflux pump subunit AcrA (membrane-fusion protein)
MRTSALLLALFALACRNEEDSRVQGTGTLEVVEVDIAPLTPARVVRVWRSEGDTVRAGDTLVSMTQSTIQADVNARRARAPRRRHSCAISRPARVPRRSRRPKRSSARLNPSSLARPRTGSGSSRCCAPAA